MAIISPVTRYMKMKKAPDGSTHLSVAVYRYSMAAQNDYTLPLALEDAKCVWVAKTVDQASEYYLPNFTAGEVEVGSPTGYMQMAPSALVTLPTATAGYIAGSALPGFLSVKHTGASATQIITIFVTY